MGPELESGAMSGAGDPLSRRVIARDLGHRTTRPAAEDQDLSMTGVDCGHQAGDTTADDDDVDLSGTK